MVYSDDWLPEQGGLEPPVSREDLPTENGAAVGDLSRGDSSILRRVSSPSVRYEFCRRPRIPVSRERDWVATLPSRRTQVFQGAGRKDQFNQFSLLTRLSLLKSIWNRNLRAARIDIDFDAMKMRRAEI